MGKEYGRNYMKKRRAERKKKGLCTACGKKNDRKTDKCSKCGKKQTKYIQGVRKHRLKNRVCYQCGREPATCGKYGIECWFRICAQNNMGDQSLGPALLESFEKQERKCVYTGIELIPGDNATLDHIVPRSRGGLNAIDNIQWVTRTVNQMKTDMTHDEFVEMCSMIVKRAA
jgi:5-methylcytosine-specific restriction endonuclease McrA